MENGNESVKNICVVRTARFNSSNISTVKAGADGGLGYFTAISSVLVG